MAVDNPNGSGVKEIRYCLTGATNAPHTSVPGNLAEIALVAEGTSTLNYYAIDNAGNEEAINHVQVNIDKSPPTVSMSASPDVLWPPNGKMLPVTINGSALDGISGISSITFKLVDEYGKVQPTIGSFGSIIQLEASRDGTDQDGRCYTITVIAKDKAGNEKRVLSAVIVPHDRRGN